MATTSNTGTRARTSTRGQAAGTLIARLLEGFLAHRTLGTRLRGYRPERHYLRGPGPACRARQGHSTD